jgi:hypothetical protein
MKTGSVPVFIRLRRRLTNNKRVRHRFLRLGALNTFYSVPSPAQKKVFDENTRGGGRHGHYRGGHVKHGMTE